MLQIIFKFNTKYYCVGIAHLRGTHSNKTIKKTFTTYHLNYLGTRFFNITVNNYFIRIMVI